MATLDFAALRREVTKAARSAFAAVRSQHPDERFYSFALYSDDAATTVYPSANTEQGFRRRIKRYTNFPRPVNPNYLRWGTAEWAYEYVGSEHFGRVGELIDIGDQYGDGNPDEFDRFKGRVFGCMVLGLRDLDAEGFFGSGAARGEITLLCSVSDSECAVWLEEESARRLNPAAVYRSFFDQWGPVMSSDSAGRRESSGLVYTEFRRFVEE